MSSNNTNAFEKLAVSMINTSFVLILSLPLYFFFGWTLYYRVSLVIIFFFYNIISIFISGNRTLGMIFLNIHWKEEYSLRSQILYIFLYTLSFSTLVIWIFLPFDLLILNLVFIQLPMVLITGSTLHGYLSGKMTGVKTRY